MDVKTQGSEVEALKHDLSALREDVARLTRAVSENQKSNVNSLRDELRRESKEAWQNAKKRGDEALGKAKDYGDRRVHEVESRIEERPFLSLLIIFLVGLVIGKLTDRR